MRVSGQPLIINGTLTSANTEYEIDLPLNCHKFMIKARTAVDIKVATTIGESGTNYITVPAGSNYWEDGLRTNVSLYVQSSVDGTIVEIMTWHGGDDLV